MEVSFFHDLYELWGLNLRWKGVSNNVAESIKKSHNDSKFCVK
jgi:hypothetical protein